MKLIKRPKATKLSYEKGTKVAKQFRIDHFFIKNSNKPNKIDYNIFLIVNSPKLNVKSEFYKLESSLKVKFGSDVELIDGQNLNPRMNKVIESEGSKVNRVPPADYQI